MTLNLSVPGQDELKPRIAVFGVGGAGGNAVNNMIDKALDGVDFVVANTDAQALQQSKAESRIQLGVKVTEGLGAGAKAAIGAAAAEESIEQIVDQLAGSHMCFITAGMGGGTGTGAAPIIAQAARELGVLTVGVVTKPFQFEGAKRMRQAEEGVEALQKMVDTLIIIPNQNLFRLANEKTTFTEAFSMADDVLYQGVKGVTDLMVRPGLINLDFADVRAVMDEMGKAMMGTGEAEGEDRAIQAAEKAIANPLLDEISLRGAKGVLINITGSEDLTLFELDEAANRIREEVDPEANIIVGSTLDPNMQGKMRVSVVATGIDVSDDAREIPTPRRRTNAVAAPVEPAQPAQPAAERPAAVVAEREAEVEADVPVFNAAEYEPQAARPAPQPVARPVEEPTLFAEYEEEYEDSAEEESIPAPAYRPQAVQPPAQETVAARAADEFVAPSAKTGEPNADTLARLQAAVNKKHQRPAEHTASEEKPRFGINSLINRMTGEAKPAAAAAPRPAPQPAPRHQPTMRPSEPRRPAEAEADADQERIEIPAFLRRQAN
ncbi:cell division protein FtsZ [Pseudooceanicola sp. C21-150M6]|uniref:cell division protein FtsZ n=1 Tax=Pseudooceanicola sp. C21-150M6 TaxID=3434355 RepID=UPI003D7F8727